MKTNHLFLLLIFTVCFCSVLSGQNIILKQTNENGIYKSGDKIRVTLFLNDKSTDSVTVKIQRNFSKETYKKLKFMGDSLDIFSETLQEPTTLVFEATSKNESASIGLIVDPEKFEPSTVRPTDFDKYWKSQKKILRTLPMNVKSVPVKNTAVGYTCFDLEINCTGPKPVRGFLAKPVSAKPKTLPIVIYFHAAGVKGDWCKSKPEIALRYAKMGKGVLSFDLNAHGMLNGQPDQYYNHLDSFELNNYAQTGLESREEIYFKGMYLRLLRTIDFLTAQPEWDGKRIVLIGESQGGGQSLIAAGLDKRVSVVIATVPAMCDWGGTLVGRKGSWPYPFSTKYDKKKMLSALPYFDAAHVLKGSKATIVVEIGLIDQTCPSSAVYAAINQAKGKKIIFAVPYRGHHMIQPVYKEIWEKTVNKPKEDFLLEYLK
jgi:cephalosporin-C deacetylase